MRHVSVNLVIAASLQNMTHSFTALSIACSCVFTASLPSVLSVVMLLNSTAMMSIYSLTAKLSVVPVCVYTCMMRIFRK